MRIKSVLITNFRKLRNINITLDKYLCFIGENNIGKSSILKAIQVLLSGQTIRDKEDYYNFQCDREHSIIMEIVLTDLSEWHRQQPAIKPYLRGDELRYRKEYWIDETSKTPAQSEYSWFGLALHEEILAITKFADIPDDLSAVKPVIEEKCGKIFRTPTIEFKEQLLEYILENDNLHHYIRETWTPNPAGLRPIVDHILPRFVLIPAVEDASETVNAKSQRTTVFKELLGLIVENRLIKEPIIIDLQGKIDEIQRKMRNDGEDGLAALTEVETSLSTFIHSIIDADIIISSKDFELRNLFKDIAEIRIRDNVETSVNRQGNGLQRALILALMQQLLVDSESPAEVAENNVPPRPIVFGIEEPELYMHPQMERKMRDTINGLASKDNFQVLATTHSPVFLNLEKSHREICRLEKNPNGETIMFQPLDDPFQGDNWNESKQFLRMVQTFDPKVNEVFFSNHIVLVEGDSEEATIPIIAEKLGATETALHDVTFVNCHGKWTIPGFIRILNLFNISYAIIHDNDVDRPRAHAANTLIQAEINENSSYLVCDNCFEHMLGMTDIPSKDKPLECVYWINSHPIDTISNELRDFVMELYGIE